MNYYYRDSRNEWHRISESSYRAMRAYVRDGERH